MSTSWIVVADNSRARIFSADSPSAPLTEVDDLVSPNARLREQDLTSDMPGRAFDRSGQGRHAMGQPTDPRRQEAIRFAKRVGENVAAGRKAGRFAKLYVVAAPAFLGLLREALDVPTRHIIAAEVDKNLAAHAVEEIRAHLPAFL